MKLFVKILVLSQAHASHYHCQMLETIRAWLNGTRDYYTGVAIYSQVGPHEDLLEVLKKGANDFRIKRLQEELLISCNELKSSANVTSTNPLGKKNNGNETGPVKNAAPLNATLSDACQLEATHKYKKVMNDRAILFNLASIEDFQDPNTTEKIAARVKLALDVVHGYNIASQLFDKADYVKLHGRLADQDEDSSLIEYDNLQDHLVKLRLDNARKAFNKLKAKEPNPERIALMQNHQTNIKKLEEKWLSLKPQQ